MSSENFKGLEQYLVKNSPNLIGTPTKNLYDFPKNSKNYLDENKFKNLFIGEIERKHGDGFITEEDLFNSHYIAHFNNSFGALVNVESKNKELVEKISKEFTKETQQSSFNKTFAFISEYIAKKEGKFNVARFDEVKNLNLSNYVAIFVDELTKTKQNLGKSPEKKVLEDLYVQFEEQKIPEKERPIIFYQTNENLTDIIKQGINEVQKENNIITIPKQVVPKLNKTKEAAYKEIELSNILKRDEELSQYVVETLNLNKANEPIIKEFEDETYFITISKSAYEKKIDSTKRLAMFKKNDVVDNELNTKMYVLSMFHHHLKDEKNNEKLNNSVINFISYEDMFNSFKENHLNEIVSFEKAYDEIIGKHKTMESTTISHNDTKWDNWFGQKLGDFGYVSAGNEYKDIARSLFGEEQMLNGKIDEKTIDETIKNYIVLREEIDTEFKVNKEEFAKNVYEMIFTESLRLAKYCTDTNKTTYVSSLMNIAKDTHDKLYESPIKHEETMCVCKGQV